MTTTINQESAIILNDVPAQDIHKYLAKAALLFGEVQVFVTGEAKDKKGEIAFLKPSKMYSVIMSVLHPGDRKYIPVILEDEGSVMLTPTSGAWDKLVIRPKSVE